MNPAQRLLLRAAGRCLPHASVQSTASSRSKGRPQTSKSIQTESLVLSAAPSAFAQKRRRPATNLWTHSMSITTMISSNIWMLLVSPILHPVYYCPTNSSIDPQVATISNLTNAANSILMYFPPFHQILTKPLTVPQTALVMVFTKTGRRSRRHTGRNS